MSMKTKTILITGCTAVLIFAVQQFYFKKKRSKEMSEVNVKVNEDLLGKIRGMRKDTPVIDEAVNTDTKLEPAEKEREEALRLDAVRKRELIARFEAMALEEKMMLLEVVPVELCLKRIQNELDKARKFEDTVKAAMSSLR